MLVCTIEPISAPVAQGGSSAEIRIVRWSFIAVAVYFAARAVTRTVVSDTPELDEAEQVIQAQTWSLGYGPQPPLYTWIQKLFFGLLGTTIFALALLNALILFATCAATHLAGKEISGERRVGLVGMWSLFFVPQFVWAAQNDLTHSDLAIFFTGATLLLTAKLLRQGTSLQYLLFGLIPAAGVLSKYNYIVFLFVLLVTLASLPAGRRVLGDRRIVWSSGLFLLLTAAHFHWVWHHQEIALRRVPDLHSPARIGLFRSWVDGFVTLVPSVAMYALPLGVAWIIVLGRLPARGEVQLGGGFGQRASLLARVLGFSALFYALAILLLRATFKERWIEPNMFALPLLLALSLGPALTLAQFKRVGAVAGTIAAVVFFVLSGRVLFAGMTGYALRANLPYRELAEQLKRSGVRPATIIADTSPLGAAFAMAFPDARVVVPEQMAPPILSGTRLAVCEANSHSGVRKKFLTTAERNGLPRQLLENARHVGAPLKYFARRSLTLDYVVVTDPPVSDLPVQ